MPASRSPHTLSVLACLALMACDPGSDPGPTGARSGPLYSCHGEPRYNQAAVDSLFADLKAHPLVCRDGESVQVGKPAAKPALRPDPVYIRAYVMDSRCRFIAEHEAELPIDSPPISGFLGDFKDAQGNSLPTGEYYVSVVVDRGAGGKDTSYHKQAIIRNPCAP